MNKTFLLLLFSISFMSIFAQNNDINCRKNLLLMSYNVENLFDTIDDPHKIDNEFLPEGKKKWNTKRYYEKLNHLATVISSVDSKKLPDLIALIEIENQTVLEDLAKEKLLKKGHYQIVHHESPDRRGIDVALFYNPKKFIVLNQHFYKVEIEGDNYFKTREILYVKGIFKGTKDTLHIFVNHWPSRRGGQGKSEHKRFAAAQTLRNVTDSLFKADGNPRIMIMGDFNDEPLDKSLVDVLEAKPVDQAAIGHLFNLSLNLQTKKDGTYYYWKTKQWNMLDQLIVSGQMIKAGKGLQMKNYDTGILRHDFFLYENKDKVKTPAKSYGGKKYYGGYSDHLPIYFYFYYKCKK
jgi:predicted extracellular nuclease